MTLSTDVPSPDQHYPPVARRSRRRWRWVLAIAAVLVVVIALLAYLDARPRLERRPNINAVGAAFDDCGLGVPDGQVRPTGTMGGAEISRISGRIELSSVAWEPTLRGDGEPVLDWQSALSWADVECVGHALGLPDEVLARIQEPGSEALGLDEGYRWGPYVVTWNQSTEDNHSGKDVYFYHDWSAKQYDH